MLGMDIKMRSQNIGINLTDSNGPGRSHLNVIYILFEAIISDHVNPLHPIVIKGVCNSVTHNDVMQIKHILKTFLYEHYCTSKVAKFSTEK